MMDTDLDDVDFSSLLTEFITMDNNKLLLTLELDLDVFSSAALETTTDKTEMNEEGGVVVAEENDYGLKTTVMLTPEKYTQSQSQGLDQNVGTSYVEYEIPMLSKKKNVGQRRHRPRILRTPFIRKDGLEPISSNSSDQKREYKLLNLDQKSPFIILTPSSGSLLDDTFKNVNSKRMIDFESPSLKEKKSKSNFVETPKSSKPNSFNMYIPKKLTFSP